MIKGKKKATQYYITFRCSKQNKMFIEDYVKENKTTLNKFFKEYIDHLWNNVNSKIDTYFDPCEDDFFADLDKEIEEEEKYREFYNNFTEEERNLLISLDKMSLDQVKMAGIVASKILELKRKEKDYLSSIEELATSYEYCQIKDYFDENKLRQSVKVQQDNK